MKGVINMMYYFRNIKNFKYWGKGLKISFIESIIRSLVFMLIAIGLYLWLNDTGLLIYLILMIKYHWKCKEEEA